MVLLVHSSQYVAPINSTLHKLMLSGMSGVQLFYIASALTLCLSWEFRRSHEISPVRNFFIRRFFRIAPMFYIAIVFYLFLHGFSPEYWAPNGIEWWFVPLAALFLHGFHPETINSVVPGGWSIAVEMSFYLILPFLLRYLNTTKSFVMFFAFSLILYPASKIAFTALFSPLYPPDQQYLVTSFGFSNFFAQLPVFAIGLLAYVAFKNLATQKRELALAACIYIAIIISLFLLHFPSKYIGSPIFVSIGFALFALLLACYPSRVLVNRAIKQLGKISFSMYLTHFAVLEAFSGIGFSALFPKGNISSILYYFCVVVVTAIVSWLCYITIEKKGILLGKMLIENLELRNTGGVLQAERS